MTIQNQVTSLQLSKRLWELGVKRESVFHWVKKSDSDEWHIATTKNDIFEIRKYDFINKVSVYGFGCECHNTYFDIDKEQICPAYLLSEITEMLPNWVSMAGSKYYLQIEINQQPDFRYKVGYRFYVNDLFFAKDDNLACAMAMVLTWLIENGHVRTEEL